MALTCFLMCLRKQMSANALIKFLIPKFHKTKRSPGKAVMLQEQQEKKLKLKQGKALLARKMRQF